MSETTIKPYAVAREKREAAAKRTVDRLTTLCTIAIDAWASGTDKVRGAIGVIELTVSLERQVADTVADTIRGLGYKVELRDDAIIIREPDEEADR